MSKREVSATTFPYLYSRDGLDALKHLATLGYDTFELMIFPPHCWPRELAAAKRSEYRKWLDGEGKRITSFCYPLLDNNPNGQDILMRQYTLDRYREAIDLASEFGCPYVVAIPGPVNSLINPPRDQMLAWFVEGMKSLIEHARGTGVQLVLENVPFTYLPSARDLAETAALIGPEMGVNFDICNSTYIKEDPAAAIRMLGGLIRNLHIAESPRDEFLHAKLGAGIVDVGAAGEALDDIGFTGFTVLEIIADELVPGTTPDSDFISSHKILAEHGWKPLG